MTAHHLYVIGEQGSGLVKVGRARDVSRRLREIQTGYPRDLAVLDIVRFAGHLESRVHQMLQGDRCRGEWFDFGDRDPVTVVREVIAALERAEAPAGAQHLRIYLAAVAELAGEDIAAAVAEQIRPAKPPRNPAA